jgi:hypothetical protein
MQSGGDKPRKSESLQAVVQAGTVGFYPLNSLGLSALQHQQAECIIGTRDDAASQKLRGQSELVVDKQTLNIQGKVFTGFSDAFYRGKLPELVIVTSGMLEVPIFIEELMDFMEKLCSLGFLTAPQEADEVAVLDRYVPQIVIASYGILFDVLLEKFQTSLANLGGFSPRQKERLLQKLSRGMFIEPEEGYDLSLNPYTLFPKPLALNLSGSKSMYTVKATQLLESHRIETHFNPNGELGVLEWEINLAHKHLLHRLFPLLKRHKIESPMSEKAFTKALDNLGQKMGILPGLVTVIEKSPTLKPKELAVSTLDLAILHQLRILAKSVDDMELQEVFDTLLEQVKPLSSVGQPMVMSETANP